MNKSIAILITVFCMLLSTKMMGQASLEIDISNIRSNKGTILISLFTDPDQFPRNAKPEFKDIKVSKKDIRNGTVQYLLKNLNPGSYAIALLDDENDSGDMEHNKIGIPLEGFGFSNNVIPILSCPPYKKCQFEIVEGVNKINIKVRYR